MSLLTPLGLVALIGLPLIIIIYILKPKYQEKTINSTYIWKLSLKYRKRKIPLQWLKRSLLLIVQLLVMAILAFMICQPFIKHPKAQYERIIILDASASMMAVDENGKSRFDKAKEDILHEAEESSQEFDMSIILCDENPDWLIQNAFGVQEGDTSAAGGNKDEQKALGVNKINVELGKTSCTNQPCDYSKAIKLADEYRQSNPDAKIILYTDHEFEKAGYVTVKNFATEGEWNASVLSVEELAGGNETLYFEVSVGSFMKAGELVLNAEITGVNGYEEGPLSTITYSQTLQFEGNEQEPEIVTIRGEKETPMPDGTVEDMRIYSYKQAKFYLTTTTGATIKDNYKYDNEYYCFGLSTDFFSARVEIDQPVAITTPPYVLTALTQADNIECTEVSERMRKQAEESGAPYQPVSSTNFDLYVYDGKMPNSIPDDGAVWLVNVPNNWGLLSELGISISAPAPAVPTSKANMLNVELALTEKEEEEAGTSWTKGLGAISAAGLMKVSQCRPIIINENNPYNFKPILTVNGKPVMIAGENAKGVRMVITSLDMRYTNFPFAALPALARNVAANTLSYTLNDLAYSIGETVNVYSKPKVVSATVSVEGSESEPLVFSKEKGEFPVKFVAEEPGVYTISQEFSNTSVPKETKFFVHLDAEECNFGKLGGILADDDGSQTATEALENSDLFDIEDITFWFALGLIILVMIEWGLQYREQY